MRIDHTLTPGEFPKTYKDEYGNIYKISAVYTKKDEALNAMEQIRYDGKHESVTHNKNGYFIVYWRNM